MTGVMELTVLKVPPVADKVLVEGPAVATVVALALQRAYGPMASSVLQ